VSCLKAYDCNLNKKAKKTALVLDYGITFNLLNWLSLKGYKIRVLPAKASFDEITKEKADLIVISNGPGNPLDAKNEIEKISKLLSKKPIIGFGLGSCLLGLAMGGETEALKSGHYGFNKAIKDLNINKVYMTQQEHRFVVNKDSLPKNTEIISINLHDNTLEAYANKKIRAAGYYYLPTTINV
jgi:carbamoyl-phosphate synthase small subunit